MQKETHKKIVFTLLLTACCILPTISIAGNNTKPISSKREMVQLSQRLNANGLRFTPNKGQIADNEGKLHPEILYKAESNGGDVYLRKTGISYVFSNIAEVQHEVHEKVEAIEHSKEGLGSKTEKEIEEELMQKEKIKIHRVDMDFEGGNKNIRTINENELDGYNNYYYAHCPNGILNVKQYNQVTYKNIYNNIDIVYNGSIANGLKYDLVVQPHADPNQIKIRWMGAENIHLNSEGHLVIKTSVNEFTESIPKVYQNINGKIVNVKARYRLDVRCEMLDMREKNNMINKSHVSCPKSHIYFVTFELGTWNPEHSLIIDPWATYYGGTAADNGFGVACDNAGNVYMTGATNSPNAGNVIATAGAFQGVGLSWDAFLVKFNSATGARTWATYYGGANTESGYSVACDNAGNVYMAGYTNSTAGIASTTGIIGFKTVLGGSFDAFLVKFNSATGARTWGTYYGGADTERATSVACDNAGNVYLAGNTRSTAGIASTTGIIGFQTVFGGGGLFDAFLVKFNSTTGARTWGTYYGGVNTDLGNGVVCDNVGNVYLTGRADSPNAGNVIATPGGFQTVYGGTGDAFLVKFNSATGTRTWGTYYGGAGADYGYSLACDNADNIYLAGYTSSPAGIASTTGSQTVLGGGGDAFLVKFNSTTGARTWGTYYGANLNEYVTNGGLAIDGNNNIYLLTEVEEAMQVPNLIDPCAYQPNYADGGEDQIIVKYNSDGKKLCATYFGGTGYEDLDYGGGIAVSGNLLFITTTNTAGGYPVTAGAWQTVHGGTYDAVLACLCTNICEGKVLGVNYTANATNVCANTPVKFTPSVTNSCDTSGYKFHWTFTGGNPASSDSISPTVSFTGTGGHNVKLVVTTVCKKDSLTKSNYITVNFCGGSITASVNSATMCKGVTPCPTLTATGGSGTAPYVYSWSTTETTQNINPCPAATTTYTVKITDSGGLTATSTAVVTVNPAVTVTTSATTISCNNSTGSASATGSNGTSPYTYSWSNGVSGVTASGLTTGNYTVTVTDNKGCTSISNVVVISPPPLIGQFTKGTANCTGCSCKEWVMVNATGGTSPYTYTWPDGYVNRYKNQLCPGSYAINIKDKNGCSINANLTTP